MQLTNQSHVVYNLGTDFNRENFYAEFGEGSTFPQIICDDNGERQKLGGCTETIQFFKENKIV